MRLTDEQFKTLSQWEGHFETAVKARYTRYPGSMALDIMHGIYQQVTGSTQRLVKSCSHCVMKLVTSLGKIYLEDKQERIDKENDRRAVELSQAEASVKKVAVKTKKPSTRKNGNKKDSNK